MVTRRNPSIHSKFWKMVYVTLPRHQLPVVTKASTKRFCSTRRTSRLSANALRALPTRTEYSGSENEHARRRAWNSSRSAARTSMRASGSVWVSESVSPREKERAREGGRELCVCVNVCVNVCVYSTTIDSCYKKGVHTFSCGKRFKWLNFFANALDHDHGRLARHLVILEENLPWRAVTEDFGPNHVV
jgi:hypothetical protein